MAEGLMGPAADLANGRIDYLFPTPLYWHVVKGAEELNDQLRNLILDRERTASSVSKSNQGGWQSAPTLLTWSDPAIARLERLMAAAVNVASAKCVGTMGLEAKFQLFAWAAVNRKGHYNTPHIHPMATWSGIYYVDPGDESADSPGAFLEFQHPITASVMTFFPGILPSARLLRPEAGLMILFPSYLLHNVRMYQGERPRICVPFNAHMAYGGA